MSGNPYFEMTEIIRQGKIKTLFQPVVTLKNGEVIGYEALSRGPSDSPLQDPRVLLETAAGSNLVSVIDEMMRKAAIENANDLGDEQLLFLNIKAEFMTENMLGRDMNAENLGSCGLNLENIVVEVSEQGVLTMGAQVVAVLKTLKKAGCKIAVDDVGGSYRGIKALQELNPDFLKLEMDMIRNLHRNEVKQALVGCLVQLGNSIKCRVVAKGIETQEELKCLIRLGVYGGQGFYLQSSACQPMNLSNSKQTEIAKYNHINEQHQSYNSHYHYIGTIAEQSKTFPPETPSQEIDACFKSCKDEGFGIVRADQVCGIITRQALYKAMATQYGHALYSKRPISLIHNEQPLIVDFYTPVNKVAELAMNRPEGHIYDPVIVCQGTKYYGMVSVRHLVTYATEIEKNYARELNPLTGLPGNTVINRVFNDAISYSKSTAVVYFDLDHFKVYNDVYGFENGDRLIKMTSSVIQDAIKGWDSINSFVGHIGGDDFVAVLERPNVEQLVILLEELGKRFDEERLSFYNDHDQKKGYVEAEDRQGKCLQFPLTALSMACLNGDLSSMGHPDRLAMEMAKLKKIAKTKPGTSVVTSNWNELPL